MSLFLWNCKCKFAHYGYTPNARQPKHTYMLKTFRWGHGYWRKRKDTFLSRYDHEWTKYTYFADICYVLLHRRILIATLSCIYNLTTIISKFLWIKLFLSLGYKHKYIFQLKCIEYRFIFMELTRTFFDLEIKKSNNASDNYRMYYLSSGYIRTVHETLYTLKQRPENEC